MRAKTIKFAVRLYGAKTELRENQGKDTIMNRRNKVLTEAQIYIRLANWSTLNITKKAITNCINNINSFFSVRAYIKPYPHIGWVGKGMLILNPDLINRAKSK